MDDDSENDVTPRDRETFVGAFVVFVSCDNGMSGREAVVSECRAAVAERDELV